MAEVEWPWQYSFPPFFTIQVHNETRTKQIAAWRSLILDYHKITKHCILDTREAQRTALFNNTAIDRKLPLEGIVTILEDLARTGNAQPLDKQKHRWQIYWHTLEEWADLVYSWVQRCGMMNTVCTLYEITDGDNSADEEFHGLDTEIMVKILQTLEVSKKAELFDDNQGVKFF
ncbi:vacuolar protein-sorting-associated protein 25 [Zootermopsis nevadensis]|uniref:Vacuolar protein-sorting-associated protein 25 n=1 Tax=Zootermopsis nevadensis TaxID=136037 RepID=A0A067QID5_ZOONE|nr:vacuolar protein-sorting-associated protein 25 [Zootermopsis nevadensis]KDR08384.1 Vacuolar protein-sorting-associated protein 25 [Zootermopsis nevadensis]